MKAESSDSRAVQNLLAALDLMECSIMLMRQNIRRALPNAPEAHIERELERWLVEQSEQFVPRPPPESVL